MKRFFTTLTCCILYTFLVSCSSGDDNPKQPEEENPLQGITAIVPPSGTFAEDDGATKSTGTPAKDVANFLTKAGAKAIQGLGNIEIKDNEYKEIKDFTSELVKDAKSDKDKYDQIFKWITGNISYAHEYVDNNPYPVFQTRKAICQGYANLLTVMLHSQDIPAVNANGVIPEGGHAWNYVYLDNEWYVSDPTNNGSYLMSNFNSYTHLVPLSLDMTLFEDDNFAFNYQEGRLNLCQVKKGEKQLTVPFSTNGFRVEAFNPNAELPSNIEEIYIGKNIQSLGESIIGLNQYAPSVKYAYVDSKNPQLTSYGQVVYRYGASEPLYVPAAATTIQLKGTNTIGKNFLKSHDKIETLVISSGTQTLEAYAIENCPNLRKAYLPKNAKVDENAFYGVHSTFQIIRQDIKE